MQDAGESGLPRTVVAFCCYCGSSVISVGLSSGGLGGGGINLGIGRWWSILQGLCHCRSHSAPQRGGCSAHLLLFPVQDLTCHWWPYIPKPILPGVEALCSFLVSTVEGTPSIGFFLSFSGDNLWMYMLHASYICV